MTTALPTIPPDNANRNLTLGQPDNLPHIGLVGDSATRFDTDMFRTVWADDAEFIIGHAPHGQSATGVDDIVAMQGRVRAGRD